MIVEIITSTILLSAGIAILVAIHVCVMGRAYRGDSSNGTTPVSNQTGRVKSMKPEDIKELLPCFDYKVDENGKGKEIGSECAVCLENFSAGDKCRMLPKCSHSFHAECIDSWLLKTAACPICRAGAKSPMLQEISGEV